MPQKATNYNGLLKQVAAQIGDVTLLPGFQLFLRSKFRQ